MLNSMEMSLLILRKPAKCFFALAHHFHRFVERGRRMPNRVIKESIWTSPNLNRLSDVAERHFFRILCLPDDFGCCELTPLVVKGKCYPLKENITIDMVKQWNTELEEEDIIRTWNLNGRIFAYFPTFGAHQRIRSLHLRKTPEPPESVTCRQVTSNDF